MVRHCDEEIEEPVSGQQVISNLDVFPFVSFRLIHRSNCKKGRGEGAQASKQSKDRM